MTNLDDLLGRVAERARSESAELPPPVSEAELRAAEDALGFRLPQVLAGLYREVANGGFGPEYHLVPLVGEGRTAVREYRTVRGGGGPPHWPAGVLPILDWGCAMYAAVDCTAEAATVLLFEPNAVEEDWTAAWFIDAESLAGWLETWLSGSGWYEEGAFEQAEAIMMRPWPDARERLVGAGSEQRGELEA